MCGIVGFWSREKSEGWIRYLREATNSLTHRGPDSQGIYLDPHYNLGLGHTRLSIIDLSPKGAQPMKAKEKPVWIVYNGEIYNFQELRSFLTKKGLHFETRSDTEVILKSYIYWGIECLQYLNGMFAFAIWDQDREILFLARDRVGKKPLYYTHTPKGFFFASELKALARFPGYKREVDMDSLALYLHYQYIPSPRTIFKATYKLKPGHYLLHNGHSPILKCYYRPPLWQSPAPQKEEEMESRLEQVLSQCVKDRLISDVPLGCLLSGGIDSSLVTALAQKVSHEPIKTFTIGFDDPRYNEAPYARAIARFLGTQHEELHVSPKEALSVIPKIPFIYDEPFADSSGIPTYLVSQLARERVKVVITGDGGDEQFCGYVRFWITNSILSLKDSFGHRAFPLLARLLNPIPKRQLSHLYHKLRPWLPRRFSMENIEDKWEKLLEILMEKDPLEVYRSTIDVFDKKLVEMLIEKQVPISAFEDSFAHTSGLPIILRLMYVDQNTYLPECMLTKVDRASMAVGLEVRCPLLDKRVFEATRDLPLWAFYKGHSGKIILKRILGKLLPYELINRPKMGFGVPLSRWFRKELKELLLDYLSPARIEQEGIFNPKLINRILEEHMSGRSNHQHRLWALLVWEMWSDCWLR